MTSPIAYVIFNRPRHTRKTFAAIRKEKPTKLFIIADGPRLGHSTDVERCREVREIVEHIDWPCEVYRNYADTNLGLKRRVSSGLDWVFKQVDHAIVLEDDCLPHPDFFSFCEALLYRYANDERVWVITGNNFQNGQKRGTAAYYFSKFPHCWGWATWKRAWRHYQGDLPFWPDWSSTKDWLLKLPDSVERKYWSNIFDRAKGGKFDSWAYPWLGCVWYHNGLTATPNVNLVTNIGFGSEATNTIVEAEREGLPVSSLGPMSHPFKVEQNIAADLYVFKHVFNTSRQTILTKFNVLINKIIRKFNQFF